MQLILVDWLLEKTFFLSLINALGEPFRQLARGLPAALASSTDLVNLPGSLRATSKLRACSLKPTGFIAQQFIHSAYPFHILRVFIKHRSYDPVFTDLNPPLSEP